MAVNDATVEWTLRAPGPALRPSEGGAGGAAPVVVAEIEEGGVLGVVDGGLL